LFREEKWKHEVATQAQEVWCKQSSKIDAIDRTKPWI
jgi:hypothetical protein